MSRFRHADDAANVAPQLVSPQKVLGIHCYQGQLRMVDIPLMTLNSAEMEQPSNRLWRTRPLMIILAMALIASACAGTATDATAPPATAPPATAPPATAPPATEAATPIQQASTDEEDACAEYVATVGVIANFAQEALSITTETLGLLSQEETLLALLLNEDMLDTLIETFDEYTDTFAAFEGAVPDPPSAWTTTDRHLRLGLTQYQFAYSSMASGLRLFKNLDVDGAVSVLTDAAGTMDRGTTEIGLATDAIPPQGC